MKKLLCVIAVASSLTLGCSGKSSDAPAQGSAVITKTTIEDRCAASVDNAMVRSKDEMTKSNPKFATLGPQLAKIMVAHCKSDKWSAEATTCLLESTTVDALDKCQKLFSAEQLKLLNDAMIPVVQGTMGSAAPQGPR